MEEKTKGEKRTESGNRIYESTGKKGEKQGEEKNWTRRTCGTVKFMRWWDQRHNLRQ